MDNFAFDMDENLYLSIPTTPYPNSSAHETEVNLSILTGIKMMYTDKIKDNDRILLYDNATYLTFVHLIDMVLYLSERVKVLEQEKN